MTEYNTALTCDWPSGTKGHAIIQSQLAIAFCLKAHFVVITAEVLAHADHQAAYDT